MKFKSSDNATPSEPVAGPLSNPGAHGAIAPTVVDPAQLVQEELPERVAVPPPEAPPVLEVDLSGWAIPEDMKKVLELALRKSCFVTVTRISNSGRFQHWWGGQSFPKDKVGEVLDFIKAKVEAELMGKPDYTGLKAQLARSRPGQKKKKRGKRR